MQIWSGKKKVVLLQSCWGTPYIEILEIAT